jgi:hypothetical protein
MSMRKFSMLDFIKEVCEEIGPRLGTTENEKKAGLKIKKILEPIADTAEMEDFTCHPGGFLGFVKIGFITCIIGAILFLWFPFFSMLLEIYAFTTFALEQMFLKEYVDFFFPKATGSNIIGKLKPSEESKKIVIVSGHHDSAYEFPVFEKFGENFGIFSYIIAAFLVLSIVSSLIKLILDLLIITLPVLDYILWAILLITLILVGYITLNLHSNKVILGANDNLSGVAVMLAIAHYFSANRLKNIELWCISFSCEECMRGSKRFVKRHYDELKNSHTVNFDMVGRGIISIIAKEPDFSTKHSLELAKEVQESSKNANLELPIKSLGYGGTDAAFFSKAKLKAISIVGVTQKKSYPDTWHTLNDTPEGIMEDRLDKALKVSIQYLKDLDNRL